MSSSALTFGGTRRGRSAGRLPSSCVPFCGSAYLVTGRESKLNCVCCSRPGIVEAVRIASLLPSATEIVCALGARAELVGRSHECDFPPGVDDVPVLTSARIEPLHSSKAIDRAVRDVLADALAIYRIDLERLREARPDVIVTQDLCDVCAVSLADVRSA